MIVLGIDPGTATTGYGLVSRKNKRLVAKTWGLIETNKEHDPSKRLRNIYKDMNKILRMFNPDVVAIEKVFFATNAKTAIRVGQAQGVMLLSTTRYRAQVYEYAPGTIKKLVSGNGRADKKQIQKSVRQVLGNKVRSKAKRKTHFDNAADALAVALCHLYTIDNTLIGGDINGKS
jgi:crossover junction endodeoxyribonuclease RuvC